MSFFLPQSFYHAADVKAVKFNIRIEYPRSRVRRGNVKVEIKDRMRRAWPIELQPLTRGSLTQLVLVNFFT